MNSAERAAQIWPVLTFAARNRQVLTYDLLSKLIGVPRAGLGQLLEPIQSFCLLNNFPPLTILVVSAESGMPGSGFVAATDIPRNQGQVFGFPWLDHPCPMPPQLAEASNTLPSNGVPGAVLRST